jgi:septal ring factor EnvC (AmiA/AmiB activator)
MSLFLLLLLSATETQPVLPAPAPDTLEAALARGRDSLALTDRQLGELSGRLAELEKKEQVSLARVAGYEEKLAVIQKYLRQLEDQSKAQVRVIAQTARRIQSTTRDIRTRKSALAGRLKAIYKYGRLLPLEALLSTRSLPEVFRRMIYLRYIARYDQRLATELSKLDLELAAQRARLLAAHAGLERLQSEQSSQRDSLASARTAEAALLKKVRTEKEAGLEVQKQLAASAQRLKELVLNLEKERLARSEKAEAGTGGLTPLKGRLPWPIRGRVVAGFGSLVHPKYKTRTNNQGILIKPEPAPGTGTTNASAVAPGRVVYADRFMGYGNLVIVDHGSGFYTLYGSLDEMSAGVGTNVAAGTPLGAAGEFLHFEIRKDGKPVDPEAWLKK